MISVFKKSGDTHMINVRRNNKIGAMGIDYTSIIPNVKLSIGMIYRTKKITNIKNSDKLYQKNSLHLSNTD